MDYVGSQGRGTSQRQAAQPVLHVEQWGEVLVPCPESSDSYICPD